MEIWRDIKGYENLYEVSNLGNVKSLKYNKERILRAGTNKRGYLMVVLCKNKKQKTYFVHRLVADAFISNPNNFPCVNHKDENSSNNMVENLEWCTYSYNVRYGNRATKFIQTRRINDPNKESYKKGIETKNKNGSYGAEKQVIQLTKDDVEIGKYKSIAEASRQTGIANISICYCCKGTYKTAGGYIWRYI